MAVIYRTEEASHSFWDTFSYGHITCSNTNFVLIIEKQLSTYLISGIIFGGSNYLSVYL